MNEEPPLLGARSTLLALVKLKDCSLLVVRP